MRILQISYGYELYGGERILYLLSKYLNKKAYKVEAVVPEKGSLSEALNKCGIKVHFLNFKSSLDLNSALNLKRFILNHGFDIVHSHGLKSNIITRLACILASDSNIKCINSEHLVKRFGFDKYRFHPRILGLKLIERLTRFRVDKFIAVSAGVCQSLSQDDVPAQKIKVIRNGIDCEYFLSNHYSELVDKNTYILGSVARLSPQKGLDIFLNAFSLLLKWNRQFKGYIAGTGRLAGKLQKLALHLNLSEYIKFLGNVENIKEFYKLLRVFVLSSHYEGLPLTVLEAMACGVPVVATDIPGTNEIVRHEVTGILVAPDNAVALYKELRNIILNKEKLLFFSKNAQKEVMEKFDYTRMGTEVLALYRSL